MSVKIKLGRRSYEALLVLLAVFFFWKVLLQPQEMIYSAYSDIVSYFSTWKYFLHSYVKTHHQLPLWNPYIFSGVPFAANPEHGLFYPLNALFILFPSDQLFGYLVALHVLLGGIFMFRLMKTQGLGEYGSFISSIVFMFNTVLISHVFSGHFVFLNIIWLPLAFLFFDRAMKDRRCDHAILAGVILAVQLFSGGIQVLFYTLFLLLLWYLYNWRRWKSSLPYFLVVVTVFLGVGAVQILPALELLHHSSRQTSPGYALTYAPLLHNAIGLLLPRFFGGPFDYWGGWNFWETASYVGVVTLVLVAFSLFERKNRFVRFFIFLSILAFSVAFIEPVRSCISLLPGFNLFRAQGRILFLFSFSAAALSGFGAEKVIERIKEEQAFADAVKISALLVAGLMLYLGAFPEISRAAVEKGLFFNIVTFLFFLSAFTVAIGYAAKTRLTMKHFKVLLVLLLLYDLWLFGMPLIDVKEPSQIFAGGEIVNFLSSRQGTFRVYSTNYDLLPQELTVRNNIQIAGGYDSLPLKRYSELMERAGNYSYSGNSVSIPPWQVYYKTKTYPRPRLLGLLNIKYVVTEYPLDGPDFALAERFNSTFIYENRKVLPRAFIVHRYVVAEDPLAALRDRDPSKVAVLEKDIGRSLKAPSHNEGAEISFYSANEILVHANLSSPGVLVLSEIWYPGWQVFDNDAGADLLRVDYTLRGVYLDRGWHEVRFTYSPASLKTGGLITLITAAAAALFLLRRWL